MNTVYSDMCFFPFLPRFSVQPIYWRPHGHCSAYTTYIASQEIKSIILAVWCAESIACRKLYLMTLIWSVESVLIGIDERPLF